MSASVHLSVAAEEFQSTLS